MRYKKKHVYSWSNEIAYLAGLIASDGSLSKDGRHIDMTSKDYEQLENFCNALGRNLKITPKNNRDGTTAFRVQFSDVSLYDFLTNSGVKPNKSKTISDIMVPIEYYFDFLRGVFDGDGSVHGQYDKRWKKSLMFYVTFYSGSLSFLKFIRSINESTIGIKGSISQANKAYRLQYAKKESTTLNNYLYRDKDCIKLTRKFKVLERFISLNENANIV